MRLKKNGLAHKLTNFAKNEKVDDTTLCDLIAHSMQFTVFCMLIALFSPVIAAIWLCFKISERYGRQVRESRPVETSREIVATLKGRYCPRVTFDR